MFLCYASHASRPIKTDRENEREWKIKIDKGEREGGRANERMVLCWNPSVNSSCNYPCSLALFPASHVWSTIWVVFLYHWYPVSPIYRSHTLLIHSLKCFLKSPFFVVLFQTNRLLFVKWSQLLNFFATLSSFWTPFMYRFYCFSLVPDDIINVILLL